MRWLQKNQAHLLVVERARNDNLSRRTRLPNKTVVFTCLVMTWGGIWLLSLALYSLTGYARNDDVHAKHDHRHLRKSSPILKELKRPLHDNCFFHPEERPAYGYLLGDCIFKQACSFRETLDEARDACLVNPKCAGVTYIPWEDRYELRESDTFHESFDGQRSFLKHCEGRTEKSGQTGTGTRTVAREQEYKENAEQRLLESNANEGEENERNLGNDADEEDNKDEEKSNQDDESQDNDSDTSADGEGEPVEEEESDATDNDDVGTDADATEEDTDAAKDEEDAEGDKDDT